MTEKQYPYRKVSEIAGRPYKEYKPDPFTSMFLLTMSLAIAGIDWAIKKQFGLKLHHQKSRPVDINPFLDRPLLEKAFTTKFDS